MEGFVRGTNPFLLSVVNEHGADFADKIFEYMQIIWKNIKNMLMISKMSV